MKEKKRPGMFKREFSKPLFYVEKNKENNFILLNLKISSCLGLQIALMLFNYGLHLGIPLYYKTVVNND